MTIRIVCAAIKHPDTGDLILGPRHFDATMHKQIKQYKLIHIDWRKSEQGFIDNHGVFLTRKEAWKIADNCGQIRQLVGSQVEGEDNDLYSENLY